MKLSIGSIFTPTITSLFILFLWSTSHILAIPVPADNGYDSVVQPATSESQLGSKVDLLDEVNLRRFEQGLDREMKIVGIQQRYINSRVSYFKHWEKQHVDETFEEFLRLEGVAASGMATHNPWAIPVMADALILQWVFVLHSTASHELCVVNAEHASGYIKTVKWPSLLDLISKLEYEYGQIRDHKWKLAP
ncbi:hypothetical protein H0H93_013106 [Arthromyces matolae]|nr:hypothetical protein H0H93_013106 [Arthromyces matolae]